MKKATLVFFTGFAFVILIARMLGWVLHYSKTVDHLLDVAMFTFIGIAYLLMAVVWNKGLLRILLLMCGVFLIVFNFIERNTIVEIVSIHCLLIPMLIARFSKDKVGNGSIYADEE